MAKITENEIHQYAKSRGGKCILKPNFKTTEDAEWKCGAGHKWLAPPARIVKRKTWCHVCSGSFKKDISYFSIYAEKRGGLCLSKKYIGNKHKLKWQCRKGHVWLASPSNISRGQWCPYCSGRAGKDLKYYSQFAVKNGGKCLSPNYLNSKTKLRWQCANGHIWMAEPNKIAMGAWCSKCVGNSQGTIDEMQDLAIARGGKCFSKRYINTETPLEWKCAKGHKWKAVPMAVRRGTWCGECNASFGERLCREVFEKIFKVKFVKVRPSWLVSSNGGKMELDGFNQKLGIAFEHQGRHHDREGSWGTGKSAFLLRKKLDKEKLTLCQKRNIKLVRVPEIGTRIPVNNAVNAVIQICKKMSIKVPPQNGDIKISWKKVYGNDFSEKIQKLEAVVKKAGGKLITKVYGGVKHKHEVQCKIGHRWMAAYHHLIDGSWCPACAIAKRHNKATF